MLPDKITLSIQVNSADRKKLQTAGQQIVLVRVIAGSPDHVVACAVFSPFGDTTAIGFYLQWEAYVMQGAAQPLNTVNLQITQPMQPGEQLAFDGTGFGPAQPAYSPTVFGLQNDQSATTLSAGLAQQLNIANDDVWQPIAIAAFPYNETSYFEPTDDLLIFLAKGITTGEILPAALLHPQRQQRTPAAIRSGSYPEQVGGYLQLPFTDDTTIHYSAAINAFLPGSQ